MGNAMKELAWVSYQDRERGPITCHDHPRALARIIVDGRPGRDDPGPGACNTDRDCSSCVGSGLCATGNVFVASARVQCTGNEDVARGTRPAAPLAARE